MAEISKRSPYLAGYVLLAEAIAGMQFSEGQIGAFLTVLLDPKDFELDDIPELVEHLKKCSKSNIHKHTLSRGSIDSKQFISES